MNDGDDQRSNRLPVGTCMAFGFWFTIVALIASVLFVSAYSAWSFRDRAAQTIGTVIDTRIETGTDSDGHATSHTVLTIEYRVGDRRYEMESTGKPTASGLVDVFYDPEKPEESAIAYGNGLAIGLAVGGAAIILIFGGIAVVALLHVRRRLRAVSTAERDRLRRSAGPVTGIASVQQLTVSGMGTKWFIAVTPEHGQWAGRTFVSEALPADPSPLGASTATVYVDPEDDDRYWVDIDSAALRPAAA